MTQNEPITLTAAQFAEARRVIASRGGRARAQKLSAKRRSEIARMGGKARRKSAKKRPAAR